MHFEAIVHAPVLSPGTLLNIAEADQHEGRVPGQLAIGSEVRLRFGVCCPDRKIGLIIAQQDEPARVVLAIGSRSWTLHREGGGITSPGLVSEHWYVGD